MRSRFLAALLLSVSPAAAGSLTALEAWGSAEVLRAGTGTPVALRARERIRPGDRIATSYASGVVLGDARGREILGLGRRSRILLEDVTAAGRDLRRVRVALEDGPLLLKGHGAAVDVRAGTVRTTATGSEVLVGYSPGDEIWNVLVHRGEAQVDVYGDGGRRITAGWVHVVADGGTQTQRLTEEMWASAQEGAELLRDQVQRPSRAKEPAWSSRPAPGRTPSPGKRPASAAAGGPGAVYQSLESEFGF